VGGKEGGTAIAPCFRRREGKPGRDTKGKGKKRKRPSPPDSLRHGASRGRKKGNRQDFNWGKGRKRKKQAAVSNSIAWKKRGRGGKRERRISLLGSRKKRKRRGKKKLVSLLSGGRKGRGAKSPFNCKREKGGEGVAKCIMEYRRNGGKRRVSASVRGKRREKEHALSLLEGEKKMSPSSERRKRG